MSAANIALGVALLLFGRRLYWLFVAIVGFLLGAEIAANVLGEQPQWVAVLAAAIVGLIGAGLAMLAQRVAFALAGLLAGGYLAMTLAEAAGWMDYAVALQVAGALIGCVIAIKATDPAIIALSCLAGSAAIVGEFSLQPTARVASFVVLAVVGMAIQTRDLRKRKLAQLDAN